MTADLKDATTARKTPRQARSAVTVEAIFEATIQVLLAVGPGKLTTTAVAERAGVSVGSLYQYFPQKQALFYAVNDRYLTMLAERVEVSCRAHHGAPYGAMAEAVIRTYIEVKTERCDMTAALYRAAAEVNVSEIIETMSRRVEAASHAMFTTASDARFANLSAVNLTLMNVLFGTVRNVFDRGMSHLLVENGQQAHLIAMFCSYLDAARLPIQRQSGNYPPSL